MKILLVHHSSMIGGGTISALDVVKMLRMLGHQVVLAVPQESDILKSTCSSLNVEINVVGPPPLFTYHSASTNAFKCVCKYLVSYFKQRKYWYCYLKELAPDLVVLNSVTQAPIIQILKKLGIKTICTIRETFRASGFWIVNYALRKMVSEADAALFLTDFDKSQWATRNIVQKVLPDVVDDERYVKHSEAQIQNFRNTHGLSRNTQYMLYLGGIAYAKGAKDLLEAYNLLESKNRNVGLILIGNLHNEKSSTLSRILHYKEIKYRKDCRSIIQTLKEKKYPVIEVGLVSDTSYWYEVASAVIFPVKMVHQPRPAYEAGYYKKPVILPAYDNFKEYLINGKNGLIYEINDISSLAEKMYTLVSCSDMAGQMGCINYEMYKNTHSFGVGLRVLKDVLDNLRS